MKNLPFLLCIFILVSCAKSTEDQIDAAKQSAKYYLTNSKCSKAREALEDVGYQSDDQIYISLLASTYGCEADYSELDLIAELGVVDADAANTLGTLVLLSTSNEEQADSDDYTNLFTAIETLMDSGGGDATGRISTFGKYGAENIHFQSMLLIITELGKFFAYYGNSTDGVKGDDNSNTTNVCLFSYQNVDATAAIALGGGGACQAPTAGKGHPDLIGPATNATTQRRLCEGIYLFNHLRDIVANVDLASSSTFSALDGMSTSLESAIDTARDIGGADITTVRNIKTMDDCMNLGVAELEKWYAIVFETAFQ